MVGEHGQGVQLLKAFDLENQHLGPVQIQLRVRKWARGGLGLIVEGGMGYDRLHVAPPTVQGSTVAAPLGGGPCWDHSGGILLHGNGLAVRLGSSAQVLHRLLGVPMAL